ncbi:hypothetical protein [Burkholderia gladioli]|uniref:Uncharacterized protein n=1 Tax=Burkholderia gladioli (strain BSR3) TaxID=999541 RepID=F2LSJ3_BURGS|nr:hypothetical protein [Burkholderia gladioli]AEA65789.1 hypothetical protein bgla_3p0880 [Burkholderia gladioli BSR3]
MREPLTDWNKEWAACADEAAEKARNELLPAWFNLFLTNVCELPDRNSPDDEPEAIFATLEELRNCAISAIEQCAPPTPTVAADAAAPSAQPTPLDDETVSVIRSFIDRPGETYRGVITTRLGIGFGRALRRAIEESRATPTSTFAPAPDAMEAFKKVLESLQTGVPETIGYGAQTKQAFSEGWNAALNMVYERSEGGRALLAAAPTPTVAPASSARVDETCKCRRLGDWKGFHHPLCDKASENEQPAAAPADVGAVVDPTGDQIRGIIRSVGSLGTNHVDAPMVYVLAGWRAAKADLSDVKMHPDDSSSIRRSQLEQRETAREKTHE